MGSNENLASKSFNGRVVQNAPIDTFDINGKSSLGQTYDDLDKQYKDTIKRHEQLAVNCQFDDFISEKYLGDH